MKVLTNRNVFAGVARRVAVNTAWASVFTVPIVVIGLWRAPWAVLLLLATLSVIYALAVWGTVAFAKWLIPKSQREAEFERVSDDEKAAWIVGCAWWG